MPEPIFITDDGQGIAKLLAQKLNAKGYQTQACKKLPSTVGTVILLDGLKPISSTTDAIAINRAAFQHAQTIAPHFTEHGGVFISVQNTGGQFACVDDNEHQAWSAGLTGLVKTAAHEWPKALVKAIDINCQQKNAEQLCEQLSAELLTGSFEVEVGLAKQRYSLAMEEANVKTGKIRLSKNAVVLASGGARGVTADCLLALAQENHYRFVLLGRTKLQDEPIYLRKASNEAELKQTIIQHNNETQTKLSLPEINRFIHSILAQREIKRTLKQLQHAGSEAVYLNVDIQQQADIEAALTKIHALWGPIKGLIHGAGVLADKLITQKTLEQFDRVFNTKVLGLQNLLNATANEPLEAMVLFSSVAARFGNQGQCDYAMANEVLNKVAHFEQQRRGKKCLVKSINWGPWDSGMVTAELKRLFEQRGIATLPVDIGANMFVSELKDKNLKHVECVIGGMFEAPSQTAQVQTFTLEINAQTHDYLHSHTIKGTPVIPAVLGLEWFFRAAKSFYPTLTVTSCENFNIIKGIRIFDFNKTSRFCVRCDKVLAQAPLRLALSLIADDNTRHYKCELTLTEKANTAPTNLALPQIPNAAWPWQLDEIYEPDDTKLGLFHGPQLHVIKTLDHYSKSGADGTLVGLTATDWPQEDWQLDVAALDGAMQLITLWGCTVLDKRNIPTKFGQFIPYQFGPISGPIRCVFAAKAKSKYGTDSNIYLLDKNEQLIAEFKQAEMWIVPNEEKHDVKRIKG